MQKSGEDYLEAIYDLGLHSDKIRITDVANYLGVSKPSVNHAMKVLAADGYVIQEYYGDIKLTNLGKAKGEQVYNRHHSIKNFLMSVLGVDEEHAEQDACLIEHDVSTVTMRKIIEYMKK